jgi:hypothetical protein
MSQNIPGIHNYCDRWCERCCFTYQCALYENMKSDTEEQKNYKNKAFWDKLAEHLQQSIDFLHQAGKKAGIDLQHVPAEELDEIALDSKEKARHIHEDNLIGFCTTYSKNAMAVLEDEGFWKQKANEMIEQQKLGTADILELEDQLHLLKECRAVISWYLFFIQVKFSRALSGLLGRLENKNDIQSDSNGSAKIALIAVNRSREAWTQLFSIIPDEDKLFPLLSVLTQIERLGTEKFPRAMQFMRPGFDQNVSVGNKIFSS